MAIADSTAGGSYQRNWWVQEMHDTHALSCSELWGPWSRNRLRSGRRRPILFASSRHPPRTQEALVLQSRLKVKVRVISELWLTILLSGSLATAACSTVRDTNGRRECASWQEEIQGLFAERCSGCHAGDAPAGDYDTSSYQGVLGTGSDGISNLIAGEESSKILEVLQPENADSNHQLGDSYEQVRDWVVACEASYFESATHEGGIMNPADDDFHGRLLESRDWDFAFCAGCHGDDFAGGKSKAACTTCHQEQPTSCDTCHGSGARFAPGGAHQTHLVGAALGKQFDCDACHDMPTDWSQIDHIRRADGSADPRPAEIRFGALAGAELDPEERQGPPSWEPGTATCQNIYCHGAALGDTASRKVTPVWTEIGTGQADCGSCHGLPPADHASESCANCHAQVIDEGGAIINLALHLDGSLSLGDGSAEECASCHGKLGQPAPPRDLAGGSSTSRIGVGAHMSHLVSSRLRGPIACAECHVVPENISSPGHIDTDYPAEVFAGLESSSLAFADGASAIFDRSSETCTVYCHGGGTMLSADTAALNQVPIWTLPGGNQATCGNCHGLPPQDGSHVQGVGLGDCVNCHSSTVDSAGGIIVNSGPSGFTSNHIDGVVNVP